MTVLNHTLKSIVLGCVTAFRIRVPCRLTNIREKPPIEPIQIRCDAEPTACSTHLPLSSSECESSRSRTDIGRGNAGHSSIPKPRPSSVPYQPYLMMYLEGLLFNVQSSVTFVTPIHPRCFSERFSRSVGRSVLLLQKSVRAVMYRLGDER